jgi:chemotaxis protein MotB
LSVQEQRLLLENYRCDVAPEQLIAAGRSFMSLTTNDTNENRATNRRTRIVISTQILTTMMSSNN